MLHRPDKASESKACATRRKNSLRGFRIREAPPFLRHFTAKFDRV